MDLSTFRNMTGNTQQKEMQQKEINVPVKETITYQEPPIENRNYQEAPGYNNVQPNYNNSKPQQPYDAVPPIQQPVYDVIQPQETRNYNNVQPSRQQQNTVIERNVVQPSYEHSQTSQPNYMNPQPVQPNYEHSQPNYSNIQSQQPVYKKSNETNVALIHSNLSILSSSNTLGQKLGFSTGNVDIVKYNTLNVEPLPVPEVRDLYGKLSDKIDRVEDTTGLSVLPLDKVGIVNSVKELQRHNLIPINGRMFVSGTARMVNKSAVDNLIDEAYSTYASGEIYIKNLIGEVSYGNETFKTRLFNDYELEYIHGRLRDFNPKCAMSENGDLVIIIGDICDELS